jgi:hypothetical protein
MTKSKNKSFHPFVSVCTPTYNRRPFIENMFQCFRNQDYPKDRIEWIIVDDGTDKINDLVAKANIPQIKYFSLPEKLRLGAKRNLMHSHAKGAIIVYFDDDDYYPPERISHAVERLESNKHALCAGSSELYIYFKHINKMVQCGPYGPNHATAGTFAFRSELLKQTRYEDHAALAEESAFLKNYTIPFVQLDPMKTILVFSHEHNTFDKRKMLEKPHPSVLKESSKKVDDFITKKNEASIKDFFMNRIDKLLENYEPGLPKMKPDVLEQMKELDKELNNQFQQSSMDPNAPIMLQRPGDVPIQLSSQDVVNIIQQQKQQMGQMQEKINELENRKSHNVGNNDLLSNIDNLTTRNKKLETMVIQLQKQLMSNSENPEKNNTDNTELLTTIDNLTNRNKTLESMVIQLQKQLMSFSKNNVPEKKIEQVIIKDKLVEPSKTTPIMYGVLDD